MTLYARQWLRCLNRKWQSCSMLKKIAIYAGYAVLWAALVAMVVWAESLSRKHDTEQTVGSVEIAVSGGGDQPLVDDVAINLWLKHHNMHPESMVLSKVDIAAIENTVEEHDAVADANVYITYDGSVEIDICQREPVARLRIDGYDRYLTADGYLLPTTDGYAVRVPVVTGNYKPLFGRDFTGYAEDVVRDSIAALDVHIAALEDMKLPYYNRLITNNKELRIVKRERVKRSFFTSDEEYDILLNAYKERKSIAQARHSAIERQINGEIAALAREQDKARHQQDEIRRQEAEFKALTSLLLAIRDNSFWSAEVVQIVATGGGREPLQLAIIPRSGRFTVDLGTTEELEQKLHRLYRFYTHGLDNVGWDRYRSISLRYKGQVVCR